MAKPQDESPIGHRSGRKSTTQPFPTEKKSQKVADEADNGSSPSLPLDSPDYFVSDFSPNLFFFVFVSCSLPSKVVTDAKGAQPSSPDPNQKHRQETPACPCSRQRIDSFFPLARFGRRFTNSPPSPRNITAALCRVRVVLYGRHTVLSARYVLQFLHCHCCLLLDSWDLRLLLRP